MVGIGFDQSSYTAIEGLDGDISVCVDITIPSGKQLGCDIEVPFTVNSGPLARKYKLFVVLTITHVVSFQ